MSGEPDDFDLRAAEYVLGTLEVAEVQEIEAQAAQDPALRSAITAWQERLAPLSQLVDPVDPPADLWARIAATTGVVPTGQSGASPLAASYPGVAQPAAPLQKAWRNVAFWRGATAAGFAIAAGLALFIYLRPPASRVVATLGPPGTAPVAFVAEQTADGRLHLVSLNPEPVASDKDLEVWALPAGATRPVSLGLVSTLRSHLPPGPQRDIQLLVSLEPQGGSPTGLPTGPVLYQGKMRAAVD